jgi:hypothetical protein
MKIMELTKTFLVQSVIATRHVGRPFGIRLSGIGLPAGEQFESLIEIDDSKSGLLRIPRSLDLPGKVISIKFEVNVHRDTETISSLKGDDLVISSFEERAVTEMNWVNGILEIGCKPKLPSPKKMFILKMASWNRGFVGTFGFGGKKQFPYLNLVIPLTEQEYKKLSKKMGYASTCRII